MPEPTSTLAQWLDWAALMMLVFELDVMDCPECQGRSIARRHVQQPKGRRNKSCCMKDEGRPLGIEMQILVPNHLELRGLRALVVSVEGKGAARLCQVYVFRGAAPM